MVAETSSTPEPSVRVAVAQLENVVGDLDGNVDRIAAAMDWAAEQEADVLLLPELALTGYPLEDLAVRQDFVTATGAALSELAGRSGRTTTVVGTIDPVAPQRSWDTRPRDIAIGAAVLADGEVRGVYHKVLLPNYEAFNEARNFAPGGHPAATWLVGETTIGISICEDSWSEDGPPESQAAAGAQLLLLLNASPFHRDKSEGRLEHCRRLARRNGMPVVYVNSVGAQDELVFDGGSLVVDADGELLHRAPQFEVDRFCLDLQPAPQRHAAARPRVVHARRAHSPAKRLDGERSPQLDAVEQAWEALVLGVREFAHRNGTADAIVGISGGIDSSVTAAVAADALGPDHVLGVAMPASTTPAEFTSDALALAGDLGIDAETVAVEEIVGTIENSAIEPIGWRTPAGTVQRDLLARTRGAVLTAISDSLGCLALASVNKTELSLGSATLHGDMAGGYAPLKDCQKTFVYELAHHRNARGRVIPERTFERVPTILRLEDVTLGSLAELDPILERRLEYGEELDEIVAAGFDPAHVRGVLQLIDASEQPRRQSPPGVKITRRAFGTDRRMPITNVWRPYRREQELLAPGVSPGPVPERGATS